MERVTDTVKGTGSSTVYISVLSHDTVNSTSNSTGSVPEIVRNQKQYGKQYRNSKENSTGPYQ